MLARAQTLRNSLLLALAACVLCNRTGAVRGAGHPQRTKSVTNGARGAGGYRAAKALDNKFLHDPLGPEISTKSPTDHPLPPKSLFGKKIQVRSLKPTSLET